MKQLIFTFVLALLLSNSYAQDSPYTAGRNLVALSASGQFGANDTQTRGNVNGRFGHFFADQINAGVELGYVKFGNLANGFELGPFARYYIMPTDFSLVVEANYLRGSVKSNLIPSSERTGYNKFGLAGGVSYTSPALNGLGAEILVENYWLTPNRTGANNSFLTFVGRLVYFF